MSNNNLNFEDKAETLAAEQDNQGQTDAHDERIPKGDQKLDDEVNLEGNETESP
jgi:hypothetical protein